MKDLDEDDETQKTTTAKVSSRFKEPWRISMKPESFSRSLLRFE